MSNAAPSPTAIRIEALLPLMRGWLMLMACVLIALAQRSGSRHRRLLTPLLQRVECGLRNWVFVSALQRITLTPGSHSTSRPRSQRSGFRYQLCRTSNRRRYTQSQRVRGSMIDRLKHVYAVAADAERIIARMAKRLAKIYAKGLLRGRLISVAPPRLVIESGICASAPDCADSS